MNTQDINDKKADSSIKSSEIANKTPSKLATPIKRGNSRATVNKAANKRTTGTTGKKVGDISTITKSPAGSSTKKTPVTDIIKNKEIKVGKENAVEVATVKLLKEEVDASVKDLKEKKKSTKIKSGKIKKSNKKMIAEKKQVKKTAKKVNELKYKLKKAKKKDAKKSVIKKVKSKLSDSKKTLKSKKARFKKALKK